MYDIIELNGKKVAELREIASKLEVKRGDKIIPAVKNVPDEIFLAAAEGQTGYIIDDLEQHNLLGKYNVVVLDLGADQVSAGTIMGIYRQGPKIIDGIILLPSD
jgi:hypothetical protein